MLTTCLIIIVIAVVVIILAGIRVVKEYERGVIFRLGRLIGAKGPGLFYVIPILDSMVLVDLRTKTVDVPPQEVITKDNLPIKVNAVLYFRVHDPTMAVVKVERFQMAISQASQTTLRNVIGQQPLDALLTQREQINSELKKIIDAMSDPWGLKVSAVEIKDVEIPKEMQRAMAKEAEAAREKKARIIKAEGELLATEKLSEAAKMIEKNPAILELRRMQMVTEVGMEQNTTTIVLMPTEFVTFAKSFEKIASTLDKKL